MQFIFNGVPEAFAWIIGDYHGRRNNVIRGHWDTGRFGNLAKVLFTKIDDSAFDLNDLS